MATQPKVSIIEYAMIGGVGFVVYKLAKSGSLGSGPQKAALDLCSSFMPRASCMVGVTLVDDTGKPIAGSGVKPPVAPVPGGSGRSYPCGFTQDNGDGTFSFVENYAPGGFTARYTGAKAAAEQAFNASGLTWCK